MKRWMRRDDAHRPTTATDGSEFSPLLSTPRSASSEPIVFDTENVAATADGGGVNLITRNSVLSFSHEFRPFEKSHKAIAICLVHIILYFGIAIGAYGYGFEKWGFLDAMYFAVVIFTTIGYGDLSPSSDASRLFTIFFALYGIGILGAFLTIIGSSLLDASHKIMSKSESKYRKRILAMFSESDNDDDDFENQTTFCRMLCMTTMIELPIIVGLLILTCVSGIPSSRSVIESTYFAVVSATTIGFGDFVPKTTAMRAVCIFYLPLCVGVFGQVLSRIAGVYMELKARQEDEKFLKRSLALRDLKAMDVNGDGKVSYGEFLSFILVALEKVDKEDVDEVKDLFESLDVTGSGFLEKEDLIKLANTGDTRGSIS